MTPSRRSPSPAPPGLALLALWLLAAPAPPAAAMLPTAAETLAHAADSAAAAPTRKVGDLMLTRCGGGVPAYCGRLDRPLDPKGGIPGRVSVYFEFYPHTGSGPAQGTLVATEGGPGYPATGSREDYLALMQPLRGSRDLVLMDNRGTGRSGALDCPALQAAERWTTALVGACGARLGVRAALYGTAFAADDLAALLAALHAGKIDLYGDSYGTYFEQVFALRHPGLLRSVVLDGAYPLNGPDYAWYPSYAPAMRAKFNLACARSASCAALPGNSLAHIEPALDRLRARPLPARAADADGTERTFTADAAHLATVMFGGTPAELTVRELDAAARAFAAGDQAPLLRLMAEAVGSVDSADARNAARDITAWSAGLEVAVMCHDPPQIFDMRLAPALRRIDRDRALAARRRSFPDTYAPFTIDEYRGMPLDYSYIDQCVDWPVAPAEYPAGRVTPPHAAYPDVPALVISGELDDMTTPADGAATARAFRRGTELLVVNSFHVNALPRARSACAAEVARHFIATLETGDTACAARVPPVRLVARFARRTAELEPALALPGNGAAPAGLRAARAALETAGDVLARLGANTSGRGVGLRGGTFRITRDGGAAHVALDRVRWTEDLAVSGTLDRSPDGRIEAHLDLDGSGGLSGRLDLGWGSREENARARIEGALGGVRLSAEAPAP